MRVLLEHERACLFAGDSAELGEYLPENSVDAIVCDPPAAISFMGKTWDDDRGGFDGWTKWLADVLAPSFRALKPGGHALFWALPRTSDWTMAAVRRAGFEIRDVHHDAIAADTLLEAFVDSLTDEQRQGLARLLESQCAPIVYHAFGSGFPKSLDISKAIDQHLGATRPVVGRVDQACGVFAHSGGGTPQDIHKYAARDITAAGSAEAAAWSGWGTALKPAVEHWILARKPLEGTYAENVLAHGTGGLNIDATRIGSVEDTRRNAAGGNNGLLGSSTFQIRERRAEDQPARDGRWPAHLSLQHAPGCRELGTVVETAQVFANAGDVDRDGNGTNFAMGVQRADGEKHLEHVKYACAPGCPVAELDAQSAAGGMHSAGSKKPAGKARGGANAVTYKHGGGAARHGDKGGASRFFYCAKAPRSEKDDGLGHLPPRTGGEATGREDGSAGVANPRAGAGRTGGARNHHPTSKSVKLMRWLIQLVTPPGGTVLDPFAGSGTTGVAALNAGFSFIGSELGGDDGEYLPILVGRVRHALGLPPDLTLTPAPPHTDDGSSEQDESDPGSEG